MVSKYYLKNTPNIVSPSPLKIGNCPCGYRRGMEARLVWVKFEEHSHKLFVTLESVLKLSWLLPHKRVTYFFCMPNFMVWWVRQCEKYLRTHGIWCLLVKDSLSLRGVYKRETESVHGKEGMAFFPHPKQVEINFPNGECRCFIHHLYQKNHPVSFSLFIESKHHNIITFHSHIYLKMTEIFRLINFIEGIGP